MDNIIKLKASLRKEKLKGLALDIDETLSFTASYWGEELSKKFGNPENLTAEEIFKKYKLIQNYPHWQTKEALEWIEMARESNKIQKILPLIKRSNHFVNKINKLIPIVCYLTTRPDNVVEGTRHWLNKHGFPKAEIIAKPRHIAYEDGTKWKARVLKNLYPQILGIVDDNPRLIEALPKDYKGYIFLYDYFSYSSEKESVFIGSTWEDVFKNVVKLFQTNRV